MYLDGMTAPMFFNFRGLTFSRVKIFADKGKSTKTAKFCSAKISGYTVYEYVQHKYVQLLSKASEQL